MSRVGGIIQHAADRNSNPFLWRLEKQPSQELEESP